MKKVLYLSAFLFLFTATIAFAQQEPVYTERIIDENTPKSVTDEILKQLIDLRVDSEDTTKGNADVFKNTTSCFDYYTFGSVKADISSTVESSVPGAPITFRGSIKNTNAYPILNGALYVKVFKLSESSEKNANGPSVVDQFFVKEGITLDSNQEQEISFDWNIPSWATNGEYQVATFFVSNQAYNFLGLSFTDDITGNVANFNVNTELQKSVTFNKNTVKINNERYNFAAFPPRLSTKDPVNISATVENTTNEAVRVPVSFKLYQWDSMREENELQKETRFVDVPANSSTDVSFKITDNKYPVYLAEIILQYKDMKSILNPRFVREGISRPRINFPGVSKYPLKQGEETALFACVHNMSDAVIKGSLKIKLLDSDRNVIHEYEYDGSISGEMRGLADKFIPTKSYGDFTLVAQLFQDGNIVEETEIAYRCDKFESCDVVDSETEETLLSSMNILILVGVLIFLIILAGLIFKVSSNKKITSTTV
ncbi:MAG: hypothetical protein KBD10_01930 [Candidatus Pacebacteria bacterium]|nr:hypothetical protein [Candidatus Paceibacterota bacterium]